MKKLETSKIYHQNTDYKGSTFWKEIAKTTVFHTLSKDQKESKAFDLGSAIHCAMLEPERFSSDFAVSQKFDRRTKEGKAMAEAFELANAGKTILDEDQMTVVEGAISSLRGHDLASGMLTGGEAEYSYYTNDPVTGIGLKCRPDYFNKGALIDLKTCQDASNDGFVKACVNFGYHIQAAFYLDVFNLANGTDLKEFYFVAVETSKPFAVNTFLMGEAELALGRAQYQKAIKQYAEYLNNTERLNDFGYEKKINEIVFPMWAFEKMGA